MPCHADLGQWRYIIVYLDKMEVDTQLVPQTTSTHKKECHVTIG